MRSKIVHIIIFVLIRIADCFLLYIIILAVSSDDSMHT